MLPIRKYNGFVSWQQRDIKNQLIQSEIFIMESQFKPFDIKASVVTGRGLTHTSVVQYRAVDQHWHVVMAYLLKGKIVSYEGEQCIEEYLRGMLFDLDGIGLCSFCPNEEQLISVEVVAL